MTKTKFFVVLLLSPIEAVILISLGITWRMWQFYAIVIPVAVLIGFVLDELEKKVTR